METIKQFFIDNSSQIWTLISVFIGGFITYVSTYSIERHKYKIQTQREKVDKVLIPFCTCIEKTIEVIDSFSKANLSQASNYFHFHEDVINNDYDLLGSINKVTSYLNAEKRVYLSKSLRYDLRKYSYLILTFLELLDQERIECYIEYNQYIKTILKNFKFSNGATEIDVVLDPKSDNKIAATILRKNELSLREYITQIGFEGNGVSEWYDAPEFYYDKFCCDLCRYDILAALKKEDSKVPYNFDLFDFIRENTYNENENGTLKSFINQTESRQILLSLYDMLKSMRESVLEIIDNVTM